MTLRRFVFESCHRRRRPPRPKYKTILMQWAPPHALQPVCIRPLPIREIVVQRPVIIERERKRYVIKARPQDAGSSHRDRPPQEAPRRPIIIIKEQLSQKAPSASHKPPPPPPPPQLPQPQMFQPPPTCVCCQSGGRSKSKSRPQALQRARSRPSTVPRAGIGWMDPVNRLTDDALHHAVAITAAALAAPQSASRRRRSSRNVMEVDTPSGARGGDVIEVRVPADAGGGTIHVRIPRNHATAPTQTASPCPCLRTLSDQSTATCPALLCLCACCACACTCTCMASKMVHARARLLKFHSEWKSSETRSMPIEEASGTGSALCDVRSHIACGASRDTRRRRETAARSSAICVSAAAGTAPVESSASPPPVDVSPLNYFSVSSGRAPVHARAESAETFRLP